MLCFANKVKTWKLSPTLSPTLSQLSKKKAKGLVTTTTTEFTILSCARGMNTNSLLARKGCEKCKLVDVDNINLFPLLRLVSLRARRNDDGRVQSRRNRDLGKLFGKNQIYPILMVANRSMEDKITVRRKLQCLIKRPFVRVRESDIFAPGTKIPKRKEGIDKRSIPSKTGGSDDL